MGRPWRPWGRKQPKRGDKREGWRGCGCLRGLLQLTTVLNLSVFTAATSRKLLVEMVIQPTVVTPIMCGIFESQTKEFKTSGAIFARFDLKPRVARVALGLRGLGRAGLALRLRSGYRAAAARSGLRTKYQHDIFFSPFFSSLHKASRCALRALPGFLRARGISGRALDGG